MNTRWASSTAFTSAVPAATSERLEDVENGRREVVEVEGREMDCSIRLLTVGVKEAIICKA